MKALGTDIGTIHFVGIGGIGMSGIAEVMHQLGYKVQGSDVTDSYVVEKLRKAGIPVAIGHSPENLGDAAVVVCSSAIRDNNPEIAAAAERRLPRVKRAEMLAELMRMQKTVAVAGTHGKTTTTSMVAALLDSGNLDPTVINGGIINRYGSNARLGKSEWWVIEADESDGSFLRLDGTIAVVTNIDPEHLEHYGSFDAVKDAFVAFIENVPFYGLAVLCVDHPEVQNIIGRIRDRRIVTYGFSALADVRADNISHIPGGSRFDAVVLERDGERRTILGVEVSMPGRHNIQNALAAIAVALEMGLSDEAIIQGFERFDGVKRRFTRVGDADGAIIIDDYAHHPTEIRAVLAAAREGAEGRVIAVMQPHRYTRLEALMDDFQNAFNDADAVFVTPVYPAGEEPIEGVDSAALVDGLRAHGHRMVREISGQKELCRALRDLAADGDMIICMGAGDITKWAAALPAGIRAARAEQVSALATMPKVRGRLTENAPLAPLVWFKSGGNAEWLFEPADEEDLTEFLRDLDPHVPVMALGLGSNLIVRDGGVPGVVVRLGKAFAKIELIDEVTLRCGGGASGIFVSSTARDKGIAGLEFLRGIPGTVGGFVRMNGGAYGREVKDILVSARLVLRSGEIVEWPLEKLGYTYRHSEVPEGAVVIEATFRGTPGDPAAIGAEMDAIARAREESQPLRSRTGGSTFKNPPGHKAWALVDAAGCRGLHDRRCPSLGKALQFPPQPR